MVAAWIFLSIVCVYSPAIGVVVIWRRRHGAYTYGRIRESDTGRQEEPYQFFVRQLMIVLVPYISGGIVLYAMGAPPIGVAALALALLTTLGAFLANLYHEVHR